MEHTIAALREQGLHSILTQFTDIHGVAKGKLVPLDGLREWVEVGAGFAGPSIAGTGLGRFGPRSEYYGRVQLSSLRALPFMPGVAHAVCDGYAGGEPLETCSRQLLQHQLRRLQARGWTFWVGVEPEFFLLRRDERGRWQVADGQDQLGKPSYDLKAIHRNRAFLDDMRETLTELGFVLQQIDHEDAIGQYEINYRFEDALPDPSCNVYAAIAATLAAGLDGIDRSMLAPPACNEDLYARLNAGAAMPDRLPRDLACALEALAADQTLRAAVGVSFCDEFLDLKRQEWDEFHASISEWEFQRYAALF
ncbi:hypothetical protein [Rhodoferax sp.]|uniref:hypothetical protein n=1 Tax=Rhodoferax sp. TaxID=50421 RepID=UPI00277A9BD6|nr:hypothetical protein [Rhodoferax sp.]